MSKNFPRLLLLIIIILLTPHFVTSQPRLNQNAQPVKDSTGSYNFRVELSQWEILVFDLNNNEKKYQNEIGNLDRGARINFEIVSKDVQHGFSINELEIAVASNRPEPGEEFGTLVTVNATLPEESLTIMVFCHIFCGLGHPDMKFNFIIGGTHELVKTSTLNLSVAIFIGSILTLSIVFRISKNQ